MLEPKSLPPVSVTVLGSGTSHGIPVIACDCAVCRSSDLRDRRTRSSIYIDDGITPFLVDTTPELRLQCVANGIKRVAAVLFTHPHADHVFGFDDLRRFSELLGERLPVYGSPLTLAFLQNIYPYAFDPSVGIPTTYIRVSAQPFDGPFTIGSLTVIPLEVPHGKPITHGFLFERSRRKLFAYIPDCKELPPAVVKRLRGVEKLLIDGLRDQPHPTHMTIQEAIAAGREVKAGMTILTHLTHHKSHADREAELPEGFHVAYDGMKFEL